MRKLAIIFLLALSACCESDDRDCTPEQLAEKQACHDGIPQLITEKDGVRVYRIWTNEPNANSHWTYFTTPCGDVSSTISYRVGKVTRQIPANVNGTGCNSDAKP